MFQTTNQNRLIWTRGLFVSLSDPLVVVGWKIITSKCSPWVMRSHQATVQPPPNAGWSPRPRPGGRRAPAPRCDFHNHSRVPGGPPRRSLWRKLQGDLEDLTGFHPRKIIKEAISEKPSTNSVNSDLKVHLTTTKSEFVDLLGRTVGSARCCSTSPNHSAVATALDVSMVHWWCYHLYQ